MADAQLAIKQAQDELRDYVKDLGPWVREMEAKDRSFADRAKANPRTLPPIRGSVKPSSTAAPAAEPSSPASRIASDDYRSWDKFVSKSAEAEEVAGELPRPADPIKEANAEKEKGNNFFKQGDYESAIKHYSKAMALDPSNPILPNNRGLAHLKKGDFRAAETDCSAGLALDPNNVKALWRRGIARSELGKLVESEADLELALKLDPTNKEVKKELVRVEGMIVSQRAMEKPGFESRRMKITEVDSLQSMPPTSEEPRRMKIEEVDEIATSRRMKIEEVDEIATPRRMKIEEVDEIVVSRRLKIEEVEDNEVGSVNGTVEELPSKSKSAEEPSRANGTTVGPAGQTDVPIHKPSTSAQPSAGPARQLPPPPSSMLDFERDLRGLRKDPEGLYHYFKAIEPRSLLSIMKGGLESQHLSQICTVLQKFYIERDTPETIVEVLKTLSEVSRFSMCVMFMSKSDKIALEDVFAHLRNRLEPNGDLSKLQRLYDIA